MVESLITPQGSRRLAMACINAQRAQLSETRQIARSCEVRIQLRMNTRQFLDCPLPATIVEMKKGGESNVVGSWCKRREHVMH